MAPVWGLGHRVVKVVLGDPDFLMLFKRAVIRALKAARVPFRESGRLISTWCPLHPDRETPSLVIYTDRDPVAWYCFGCHRYGLWNEIAKALKTGKLERDWADPMAFRNLAKVFEGLVRDDPRLPPRTRAWSYGAWRTFRTADLGRVHTQWWYDEIDKVRRILWPVWDAEGILVGWVARDLDNRAEGRKYRNMPRMEVLQTLWPLPIRTVYPERNLVLVEGITDALRLLANGIPALATLGTAWSKARTTLVQSYLKVDRVVLAFDPDDAGRKAVFRVGHALKRNACQVDVWSWSDDHDPGDAPDKEIAELRREVLDPRTPRGTHPWIRLGPRKLPLQWLPQGDSR